MTTTEKYKRFDPADYLDDVAGYLTIALEESGETPLRSPEPSA